jgi:hypothetical protein
MHVCVTARTTMSTDQKRRAAKQIEALEPLAPARVLAARVSLDRDDNPRITHPYHAHGEIDVNGRVVRAHVVGPSSDAALDALADRLGRQLRRAVAQRTARRHRTGEPEPGEWRHGDLATKRPAFLPRPPQERRLMRRKTLAPEPMTPVQAAADMFDLDHDFYLFRDARSGADAVIHRLRDDGRLGLIELNGASAPVDRRWLVAEPNRFTEPVALETAIEEMDAVEHRFLCFVDRTSGRASVIYRRHDGHYGVIEAGA